MSKQVKVADHFHYDIKVAAAKQGVTMGKLIEQWLRVGKAAPQLAAAANRFCDEAPDYTGRIDQSMVRQFGDMQWEFEQAVTAYEEALNPEGTADA